MDQALSQRKPKPEMPSLEHLARTKLTLNYALGSVFGFGLRGHQPFQLGVGFVRLTDKAIREYEFARSAFDDWNDSRALSAMFHGVDHLETCIASLHRAVSYLESIRLQRLTDTDGQPLIPKGREDNVVTERSRNRIRNLRAAIEHVDEWIVRGEMPVGRSTAAGPEQHELEIADLKLSYVQLAAWLTELHDLAVKVSAQPAGTSLAPEA